MLVLDYTGNSETDIWIEGSCSHKPTLEEIQEKAIKKGYIVSNLKVTFDKGLKIYWFYCDIEEKNK